MLFRSIGNAAFQKCKYLAKVTILGDGVTLGPAVFAQCAALTNDGIDVSKVVIGADATGSNSPFLGSGVNI